MTRLAQSPLRVPLWSGRPPHARGDAAIDLPYLEVYRPDPVIATGAAMLLLPGGSYTFLSERSGARYAEWLVQHGIAGVVVNFRLGSNGYRHPALLADGRQACILVRERATEWGIDPARVGVIGTSAGGHLAAMLLTGAAFADAAEARALGPTVGVLCYAVISMLDPIAHLETRGNFLGDAARDEAEQRRYSGHLRVTAATPPTFIWHTLTDEEVPATHSELFAAALRAAGIPYELHLYGHGAHALGLARDEGLHWPEDCVRWLRARGMLHAHRVTRV